MKTIVISCMVCIFQFAYSSQSQKIDREDKKQIEQHSLNSIAISIHQAANQQNITVQATALPTPINVLVHEQPAHAIAVSSASNGVVHQSTSSVKAHASSRHSAVHAAAQVLAAGTSEYVQPAAVFVLSPQHDEANYSECDCSDCQTAGESPSGIEYDTSSNKSIDSSAHESDDEHCV